MTANAKRVFYVEPHRGNRFLEIVRARPDVTLDALTHQSATDEIARVLAGAHAYQVGASRQELVRHLHVTEALIEQAPHLLMVSSNGAGFDTVDAKACTKAGILVLAQTGGNREAVAEHALGMMLALAKRFVETDRYMRRQDGISRNAFQGHDILGKTVGIVGLGNVGTRTAELCRGLFRMRVLAYDPYLTEAQINAHGARKVELDELLRESDFVSVHCPYNEETANMIGARQYALMKPDAYFITTARGGIHDEPALVEALKAKKIAGAGLDVWVDEPPPHDHPLMAFDTVIVTPHTAGVTHEARANMGQIAAEQLLLALDGGKPPRIQNPEVWPAYVERFRKEFGKTPG